MRSDDKLELHNTETSARSDDIELNNKYHQFDDCPCYAGDSITTILASYRNGPAANPYEEYYMDDADFWYRILPGTELSSDNEIVKPKVGCFYCVREITLNTGCYMFCQARIHFDRNISLVACSDVCPLAFKCMSKSTCKSCHREYIHNRYDGDICRLCAKK